MRGATGPPVDRSNYAALKQCPTIRGRFSENFSSIGSVLVLYPASKKKKKKKKKNDNNNEQTDKTEFKTPFSLLRSTGGLKKKEEEGSRTQVRI